MKKLITATIALVVILLVSSNADAIVHTDKAYRSTVECFSAIHIAGNTYNEIIKHGGEYAHVDYITRMFNINNGEEWSVYVDWLTKRAPKWWLELNELSLILAKDNKVLSKESFIRLITGTCFDEYWKD